MRAAVKDLNDPVRYLRHVIRVEGDDLDVETLLHHINDHPGGHYADEDEMSAALRYVDGKAAILEFEPEFYVTAGFAMTNFAITRGPGHATIAFDVVWHELDLIRLLAAFHPAVSIDAAVIDTRHAYDSSLTNSFRKGYPIREFWQHAYACEISPKVLSGLDDPEWVESEDRSDAALRDVESQSAMGPEAHIRVRGSRQQVQAFRATLLAGDIAHTASFLDDWDENDLIVRLRSPQGVKFLAQIWSGSEPDLEVDAVVTDPIGLRSHERFVAGKSVAARTIKIARNELIETFSHRATFWAGGIA